MRASYLKKLTNDYTTPRIKSNYKDEMNDRPLGNARPCVMPSKAAFKAEAELQTIPVEALGRNDAHAENGASGVSASTVKKRLQLMVLPLSHIPPIGSSNNTPIGLSSPPTATTPIGLSSTMDKDRERDMLTLYQSSMSSFYIDWNDLLITPTYGFRINTQSLHSSTDKVIVHVHHHDLVGIVSARHDAVWPSLSAFRTASRQPRTIITSPIPCIVQSISDSMTLNFNFSRSFVIDVVIPSNIYVFANSDDKTRDTVSILLYYVLICNV